MACLVCAGAGEVPITTKVILSSHNFNETPSAAELQAKAEAMREAGADIVKIATMANDISDAATVLSLLQNKSGGQQSGTVIIPNTSLLCSGVC
jgi:3-dehydroquinate dehydratase/shikimate dehydrogenase